MYFRYLFCHIKGLRYFQNRSLRLKGELHFVTNLNMQIFTFSAYTLIYSDK